MGYFLTLKLVEKEWIAVFTGPGQARGGVLGLLYSVD